MPLRFNRTGRLVFLVIKPKSVHPPIRQHIEHVPVEDTPTENNIDGDTDYLPIKHPEER